jgi:hypothetical protein
MVACVVLMTLVGIAGCAGKPYRPDPDQLEGIVSRAEVQKEGPVRVRVSVPSPEEAEALFGLPLYESGVQPVWIEVVNGGDSELRFAPVGTDPDYVPPFEVAYTNRTGYSGEARSRMERYLHQISMKRRIKTGRSASGFVFTAARPGTKGVTVDLFGPDKDDVYSFLFFVPVPGFQPDHAQVNFEELFAESQLTSYDESGLRRALEDTACCASGRQGDDFLNVVFIGDGDHVLQALLRAGWHERLARERSRVEATSNAVSLYGRIADAVFQRDTPRAGVSSELRLWMTPMTLGADPVWIGDVIHFIKGPDGPVGLDPDMDDARNFLLQKIWYAQSLARYGWLRSMEPIGIENPGSDALGNTYFTDGFRVVIWPSQTPVSLLEVESVAWDVLPGHLQDGGDGSADRGVRR